MLACFKRWKTLSLRLAIVVAALLPELLTPLPARAVTSAEIASSERAEVRLFASVDAIAPGDEAVIALDQLLSPSWHTYWINPGDAGLPTEIIWTAPEGVTIGPIQWPTPQRFAFEGLVNYGYADRATLLMDLSVDESWPAAQPIRLIADASWLACADICIPESQRFTLDIPTAEITVEDTRAMRSIRAARETFPLEADLNAQYAAKGERVVIDVALDALSQSGLEDVYFYPAASGVADHAAEQSASATDDGMRIVFPSSPEASEQTFQEAIIGVLTAIDRSSSEEIPLAFEISAQPGALDGDADGAPIAADAAQTSGENTGVGTGGLVGDQVATAASLTLLGAAGFAFLGGLILNLMPCVFPVLALKALSFAQHARDGGRERLTHGLAYAAGVLVSFLAFAGALIALKSAGAVAGWGFQLQTPIVVAALAYVLFTVGLNLSGVFEISGRFTGAGGSLAERPGASGSFFTGVLAALVASPCTAPFMGAALGWSLTQDAATSLAIFAALGLGFAAPIVMLSAAPWTAALLPKPGPWMVRFRQALAFPMYAAAAWLLWVLGNQTGVDTLFAALLGMVMVGLAAWALGVGWPQSTSGRRLAGVTAAGALLAALFALEPTLDAGGEAGSAKARAASALGEPFDAERLSTLRAQGRTVFVNMTADWCISCKVNERVALSGDAFKSTLEETDAVYMLGDWTRRDPEISAVLEDFGRVGVPLYVAYPAGGEPTVLPQILTSDIIRDALVVK